MRRFLTVCDPADCRRCDVPADSAECLIRKAQVCTDLMSAPIAQLHRKEIEKLSLDMIEAAGAASERERMSRQDAVVLAFPCEHKSLSYRQD